MLLPQIIALICFKQPEPRGWPGMLTLATNTRGIHSAPTSNYSSPIVTDNHYSSVWKNYAKHLSECVFTFILEEARRLLVCTRATSQKRQASVRRHLAQKDTGAEKQCCLKIESTPCTPSSAVIIVRGCRKTHEGCEGK